MEAVEAISITNRILKFLSKIKCKLICCCKSSCTMDPQTNNENITEI